ncbi:hypothetical protein QTO34_015943 [Cnephaeus nilssonii]|uniref:Translationally-controlled tumor protein n=1 Tax=Cnephaeus nilssonii TaxID=3371016 RepID=A0AA40I640_CNENI|nr:hypothetical protein QTO34_015943 [Eptesicus nilssonii]
MTMMAVYCGNASAEGPEGEGTESTVITGVGIVMNHHLQATSFTKEAYKERIRDYMKSKGTTPYATRLHSINKMAQSTAIVKGDQEQDRRQGSAAGLEYSALLLGPYDLANIMVMEISVKKKRYRKTLVSGMGLSFMPTGKHHYLGIYGMPDLRYGIPHNITSNQRTHPLTTEEQKSLKNTVHEPSSFAAEALDRVRPSVSSAGGRVMEYERKVPALRDPSAPSHPRDSLYVGTYTPT